MRLLLPERCEKGKPTARRGRKATGLFDRGSRAAERGVGYIKNPAKKRKGRTVIFRECDIETNVNNSNISRLTA